MYDQSTSVYSSVPFKFFVDDEPFYIHADLVSLHSKPLDRMMKGPFAEAQEGSAIIKDVDADTFVRFIEWAYKGYYTAAKFNTVAEEDLGAAASCTEKDDVAEVSSHGMSVPTLGADSQAVNSAQPFGLQEHLFEVVEEPYMGFGGFGTQSSKKNKLKKKHRAESPPAPTPREDLLQSSISRRPVERKNAVEIPPTRRNQDSTEVYSDVFLSHARLYVFAEKYDIQALKLLALDELHATLAIFTLYPERTGDIVDLLRYVYASTGEPREGVEDMRTLVTHYVGYEMSTLVDDEDFKDLMIEDGGPLLRDFMTMVGKRIRKDDVNLDH